MIAAPPVGISKTCSLGLVQVIAYFSSTSAALNQPPVLPSKVGDGFVNLMFQPYSKFFLTFTYNILYHNFF